MYLIYLCITHVEKNQIIKIFNSQIIHKDARDKDYFENLQTCMNVDMFSISNNKILKHDS
jgi:hypothetical protein